MTLDERIPGALAGERLDRAVALLADCSRSEASRWLAADRVQVNGVPTRSRSQRLVEGDRISVEVPDDGAAEPTGEPGVAFDLVAADEDLIVIDKPAGLVVHPGPGHPTGTLVNGLLARFPEIAEVGDPARPGIVHRLDRGTSGVMVVARSPRAYRALVDAFAAREVQREYRTLVAGHPEPGRGIVDAPVGRSTANPTRMTLTAQGRPARTRYEVRERFEGPPRCALVHCELVTGRTHQIRVHLAGIGHPVIGDGTYGGVRSGVELDRPFLHARRIGLLHPGDGAPVTFQAPLPDRLVQMLDQLRDPPVTPARELPPD